MSYFQIQQHFQIQSARFLPKLPADHPCSQMHGHTFKITLQLKGSLNSMGWLKDFSDIEMIIRPIIKKLDHQVLNTISGLENPTSEVLAKWLFQEIKPNLSELTAVFIAESPNTECSYHE